MEALYPIGFALISVLINKIPRFHILCKKPIVAIQSIFLYHLTVKSILSSNTFSHQISPQSHPIALQSNIYYIMFTRICSISISNSTEVFLLSTTGMAAIACDLTDIPLAQAGAFIFFECAGIAGNVVSTLTVEIFPTKLRYIL